jgi:NAD(P)-dependent dehydrogenase (short-subunit alcohol dehydrogenase family)
MQTANLYDLSGRVSVITGAGSGLGRVFCETMAENGSHVVCADINEGEARNVATGLTGAGFEALGLGVDVTSEQSVAAMVERTIAWTGRIDTAIANAGIMVEGDILSISLDDWHRAIAVNTTGTFLTARKVLPHLIEGGGGTLVFTASTVGLVGMKGTAAYTASKGAIVALTRQLAADYADRGVRVNAVAPGAIRTPLSESQFRARAADDGEFENLLEKVIQKYPLSRWGKASEVAEIVSFLAFEKSSWITGQIIPIDGGLLEIR